MTEQQPQPSAAAGPDRDASSSMGNATGGAVDDGSWRLAASVPGLPGDDAKVTYEGLRELSHDEFTAVSAAGDLLNRLTVSSPHQRLVQQYEVLADALDDVEAGSSEKLNARLARAQEALRAWARQAADLPATVQEAYGPLLRDPATSALGDWRDGELRQVCEALAEGGLVARTPQNELVAVLPAASPERPARAIPVHRLLAAVLSGSERLHFHVLLDAEADLHDASRRLRALEGEVLLGAPLLMRMAGTQMQLQEMHSDVRTVAETAVRVARSALAAPSAGSAGVIAPASPHPAPGMAAEPAAGETSEQAAEQAAESTEEPAQLPPVDVAAVATLLSTSVARLEQVWAEAVPTDQALLAADADKQRFGGVMTALLRQSEEAERELRSAGAGVIPHFPLTPTELAALDPQQPAAPGPHTRFLPQLYVLRDFLSELQALAHPRSLTAGPGGVVTHIAFDPAAVGRLKAQAELLGRCSTFLEQAQQHTEPEAAVSAAVTGAEPTATVEHAAELAWLHRAVVRAHEAGLPEAVVLYSHLLGQVSATEGSDNLDDIAKRLCGHLVSGTNAADALPVIVPLAHHLVARLLDAGLAASAGDLDLDDYTGNAPAGEAPADPAQS